MTKLRLDEMETNLNQMADDRTRWICYTDDPVWIARLHKLGAPFICDVGYGSEFVIPSSWVKIRPPKERTAAQKAVTKAAARIKASK